MSLDARHAAPLFVAGCVGAIAAAPHAGAEPVFPVPGNQNAADTLGELAAQGYDIQVNWVNGYPSVPLSECWVNAIHNPDGPPNGATLSTVYVDVGCPSNNID